MGDRAAQAGETFWSRPGGDGEAYIGDFEGSAAVASIMLLLLGNTTATTKRGRSALSERKWWTVRASWSACPSPQRRSVHGAACGSCRGQLLITMFIANRSII